MGCVRGLSWWWSSRNIKMQGATRGKGCRAQTRVSEASLELIFSSFLEYLTTPAWFRIFTIAGGIADVRGHFRFRSFGEKNDSRNGKGTEYRVPGGYYDDIITRWISKRRDIEEEFFRTISSDTISFKRRFQKSMSNKDRMRFREKDAVKGIKHPFSKMLYPAWFFL